MSYCYLVVDPMKSIIEKDAILSAGTKRYDILTDLEAMKNDKIEISKLFVLRANKRYFFQDGKVVDEGNAEDYLKKHGK